jgi:Dipeptidyl aminopeptidases/acylaminoacyl-peptidases
VLGGPNGSREGGVFAAVASYFGVADLRGFAEHTHDFESRYLDGLIGPLPECDALYAERAPVGHVNDATCPVLLLQGLDDPVVPPAQSESIAADLAAHGIRYAYITFEGEVARVPQGGEHRGQPGGRALLLRPDHGVHPAGRPARAARRRLRDESAGAGQRANSVARDSRTTVMRIWPG